MELDGLVILFIQYVYLSYKHYYNNEISKAYQVFKILQTAIDTVRCNYETQFGKRCYPFNVFYHKGGGELLRENKIFWKRAVCNVSTSVSTRLIFMKKWNGLVREAYDPSTKKLKIKSIDCLKLISKLFSECSSEYYRLYDQSIHILCCPKPTMHIMYDHCAISLAKYEVYCMYKKKEELVEIRNLLLRQFPFLKHAFKRKIK